MVGIEERLVELGIELSPAPQPVGNYDGAERECLFPRCGDFISEVW